MMLNSTNGAENCCSRSEVRTLVRLVALQFFMLTLLGLYCYINEILSSPNAVHATECLVTTVWKIRR